MKISVVVCVYNEEENIRPMVQQIREALKGYDYEIIYVDDGSTDHTVAEVRAVLGNDLKLIELQKNYGQSSALAAGIDAASGDYIATIDGDLQNDPSDIPMMLKIAQSGDWDLVAGIRKNRKDGVFLRKIPSRLANYIIRSSTGVKIKDYGCTLKVFKGNIAKNIGLYGEMHRFIPVLAALEGARITQVDVKHHARQHGKSKYGIGRTFRVISDLMLVLFFKRYMQKPMHLFGTLGLVLFLAGLAINIYLLILKIMGQDIWGRPLLVLGVILLIAGIQFITVGIATELQVRTYYESQDKKPYKIRKVIGGEKKDHDDQHH